ncbi:MAG TPA: CHASE3 domain-containing protein, partial [Caulobacteraceae bacterium]
MGFQRIVAAAIALALLVAGLCAFLIFTQVGTLGSARTWVDHTRTVISTNQQVLEAIREAEASERGYLLSQDGVYLKGYRDSLGALAAAERNLQALVHDNPPQVAQVATLVRAVDERKAALAGIVAAGQAGDFAAARDLAVASRGRAALDQIRADADAITDLENQLLSRRVNEARSAQGLALDIGVVVALMALIILTTGTILLARANRRLDAALEEVKAGEAERQALDALTRAIFTNVPDYLIVLNIEAPDRFIVADINPAFAKALNITPERVRGQAIGELMPGPGGQRLLAHYRRVRAGGRPVTTRDEIPQLPGVTGPRVWESILAPVAASDGAAERLIGSVRDITDRVHAEERLRDSQRMEAIGQLTGGVAHDFNNLLQVIRGNLELLQGSVAGDERGQTRLRNALYGAERAAQLTRQLLAFARRQPLEPKVVNLSRMVSDMADLLRRTLGEAIEVETVVAGGLWNTIADPAQVESALLNLALNARDAMPRGGRLTVEITNASLDETYARTARDVTPGQYVMLAVTDTGEGMSDEVRARVFEPFFTTKTEGRGTGLGLSMVYGFVKQSNGHIQVYS